jgi:hypothetical protein
MSTALLADHDTAPPDHQGQVALSLRDTVEALIGPSSVVDLTFPRARSLRSRTLHGTQMLSTVLSPVERELLLRFRHSGGHSPIGDLNRGTPLPLSRPLQADDGENVIAFVDEQAMTATSLHDIISDCGMLIPWQHGCAVPRWDECQYRRITLTPIDRSHGDRYVLFIPPQLTASDPAAAEWRDEDDIPFDEGARDIVIEAKSLIHDGGYLSEGDAKYSWLWTGPSPQFRMIVPQGGAARAEICIPRVEDPYNLDKLRVQINGRPAAFELDRWSETSGKIRIALPPNTDFTIVTLTAPKPTPDANAKRHLGLCVDKVILVA